MRILYLSRGRGFGHAVVDVQIAKWIKERWSSVDIFFASYDDGVELLKNSGFSFYDMDVTKDSEMDSSKVIPEIHRLINLTSPQLIISHEVFFAAPTSKYRSIPCIMLTHWFFSELEENKTGTHSIDKLMSMADKVLLMDVKKFHRIPPELKSRSHFVGPILRDGFTKPTNENCFLNQELKYDVLVTMGGRTKFYEKLILKILDSIHLAITTGRLSNAKLLVPGMSDEFNSYIHSAGIKGVDVCAFTHDIAGIQRSARLVIGRGSFTTVAELAVLGKPSLHFMMGDNPVDNFHIKNFSSLGTVRWVNSEDVDVTCSADMIVSSLEWAEVAQQQIFQSGCVYRNIDPRSVVEQIIEDTLFTTV